jgi:hypothetical protein
MVAEWRRIVLGLILVCAFISAGEARASMYWGGTIKGSTYNEATDAPNNLTVLQTFERDAGKDITFINTGQAWAKFDEPTMQAAIDNGAIPLVTMGLSGTTLKEVAEGKQDTQIKAWAQAAKSWGYPFLFRPWWEPNGDWYAWGRDPEYVSAWRHFHELVVAEGATNVTWAWIVNSIWSDPASDPTPYYPGDKYVDWVGMDAYNWGLNPLQPDRWLTPQQAVDPTLAVLESIAPTKPICICEDASTEIGGDKPSWVREMLETYLPHHPNIKAYLWFNWNVVDGSGRWDWPIESSTAAEQAFRDGIQSSLYLSRLPVLTKLQKIPLPPQSGLPEPLPPPPPSSLPPQGDWSGTLSVSAAGKDARNPEVAVAADGSATIVWERYDGSHYIVQERCVGPGGSAPGPVHDLSLPGQDAFRPRLALAPDGTATVAWVQFVGYESSVFERRILADGSPEPNSHQLSVSAKGQSANQVQVATGPGGGSVVVWERYNSPRTQVQSRAISPSGVPSAGPADLSDGTQNAVEPRVAVGPDGSAIVVWTRYDGTDQIVQERRLAPSGSPDPSTDDLSAAGEGAIEPALAIGPEGTATVIWVRSNGTNGIVQTIRVSAGGVPAGAPQSLSGQGEDALAPAVAVAPDGSATAVWQRFDGSHFVVQGRHLAAGGSAGPSVVNLSDPAADAREPRIAIGPDGFGTVAWDRFDGSTPVVQARRLEPSGAAQSGATTLSAPGENAGDPAVGAGGKGAVTVAWRRFDGAYDSVQAAAFGQPSPTLSPSANGSLPPLNRFTIGKPRLDLRRGTARLPVTLPGPGTVRLGGNGVQARFPGRGSALTPVRRAGTILLKLGARGGKLKMLDRQGHVKVRALVTYTPTGGERRTKSKKVLLRKRRG